MFIDVGLLDHVSLEISAPFNRRANIIGAILTIALARATRDRRKVLIELSAGADPGVDLWDGIVRIRWPFDRQRLDGRDRVEGDSLLADALCAALDAASGELSLPTEEIARARGELAPMTFPYDVLLGGWVPSRDRSEAAAVSLLLDDDEAVFRLLHRRRDGTVRIFDLQRTHPHIYFLFSRIRARATWPTPTRLRMIDGSKKPLFEVDLVSGTVTDLWKPSTAWQQWLEASGPDREE